jgi:hypothetical protein
MDPRNLLTGLSVGANVGAREFDEVLGLSVGVVNYLLK